MKSHPSLGTIVSAAVFGACAVIGFIWLITVVLGLIGVC